MFKKLETYSVSEELWAKAQDELIHTDKLVYISNTHSAWVATWPGLPAKRADFLMSKHSPETAGAAHPEAWRKCCEVGTKTGRYDGATRIRFCFRYLQWKQTSDFKPLELREHEGSLYIAGYTFPLLRKDLNDYTPVRILLWHWRRYFSHLTREDVDSIRPEFETIFQSMRSTWTLNEANRYASRLLYDCSRSLGWRKLTLRERNKLGIPDKKQWQRISYIDTLYQAPGVGECTLDAAHGRQTEMQN